jgi:hypothetical protein
MLLPASLTTSYSAVLLTQPIEWIRRSDHRGVTASALQMGMPMGDHTGYSAGLNK